MSPETFAIGVAFGGLLFILKPEGPSLPKKNVHNLSQEEIAMLHQLSKRK